MMQAINANQFTGALGTVSTIYAANVQYAAHGVPSSYQYGAVSASTQTGQMSRTNVYNPRLQLSGYTETANSSGIQLLNSTLTWPATSEGPN